MKILKSLPGPLLNLAFSLKGYQHEKTRFNHEYEKVYLNILENQSWTTEQRIEFQYKKLRNIIKESLLYVPYYRDWSKKNKFSISDFNSINDLEKFPILDQSTVKKQPHLFMHDHYEKMKYRFTKTGGTTGNALKFPIELTADHYVQAALYKNIYNLCELNRNSFTAKIVGISFLNENKNKPPYWAINYVNKNIYFSIYHLSEKTYLDYVSQLNKIEPPLINGHPSAISELATLMLKNGVTLNYIPKLILTSSETLLPHQKNAMEKAFKTKCAQLYGQTETVVSAFSKPDEPYFIDEEVGYTELEESNENYGIIGTGFNNRAFPLIRYRIGDIAILNNKNEFNDLPYRKLLKINGRTEDYLQLSKNFKLFSINKLFESTKNIKQAQFIQKKSGKIILNLVPHDPSITLKKDIKSIEDQLNQKVSESFNIEFKEVNKIECTSNGKIKLVIREE